MGCVHSNQQDIKQSGARASPRRTSGPPRRRTQIQADGTCRECDEPTFLPNGIYGMSVVGHSGLMPANFTTLAHFSISSAMNLPKPAGQIAKAAEAKFANRASMVGSARTALISLLSFSTISGGVFFGAPIPSHVLAS